MAPCYSDCIQKDKHTVLPISDANTLVGWCTQAYSWEAGRQQIIRSIAVVLTPSITKRASAKATVLKPGIKHIKTTSLELGKNFRVHSLSDLYNYELVHRTKSVMGTDTTTQRCLKPQAVPEPNQKRQSYIGLSILQRRLSSKIGRSILPRRFLYLDA